MMTIKTVCVVGGAGFVGSVLVPRLLRAGFKVKVIDLYLYGKGTLSPHEHLTEVVGDVRDTQMLKEELAGQDAVIHLAAISNDPSYALNPALGKEINFDAFGPLVDIAKDSGVGRFIYASSSSVYGVKKEPHVTENLKLEPLTDYSLYKAKCEDVLMAKRAPGFTTLILRPATVSGYSRRFRMDVVVNTLTMQAIAARKITVLGGGQSRCNLHIADMARAYENSLRWGAARIDGKVYNVGGENYKVSELGWRIQALVGPDVEIETLPTNDPRSYSLDSSKIEKELGFRPVYPLEQSVRDLQEAYQDGLIVDPINEPRFYNVRWLMGMGMK